VAKSTKASANKIKPGSRQETTASKETEKRSRAPSKESRLKKLGKWKGEAAKDKGKKSDRG